MRTIRILLLLIICTFQQPIGAKLRHEIPHNNADISLVDIGWSIIGTCYDCADCDGPRDCLLKGKFKITNNTNQQIVLTRVFLTKHNAYSLEPRINQTRWDPKDSLVLQPYGQAEFRYNSAFFLNYFGGSITSFIDFFKLSLDIRPQLCCFEIEYYIEDSPKV